MAEWVQLTGIESLNELQDLTDQVDSLLNAITAALDILLAALQILDALALATANLLEAIVSALVAALEDFIHDLLEYNIATAFHVNMNWNRFWRYSRTGEDDPRLVDWDNDNQLPWSGTGVGGWLLDILASTKDLSDPFRPVTDDNTRVYGVVILTGIADPNALEEFQPWFEAFFNKFGWLPDVDDIKNASKDLASTSRLGPACVDPFMKELLKSKQNMKTALGETWTDIEQSVDQAYRDSLEEFFPYSGAYPKWASVPFASVIPALEQAFQALRQMLGLLKPALNTADGFSKLIAAIETKVEQLRELIETITDVLDFLVSILTMLNNAYILVLDVPDGGMDAFIGDALAADNRPDFGTAGICVGFVMVGTSPDLNATLDKFMQVLGIKTSAYITGTTQRAEALGETFDEQF